jgi:PAS domain S-box-containing protein
MGAESFESDAADLAAIYEAAPVGLAFVDKSLRYIRINDRLAAIHNLPAAKHIGRTIREVLGDAQADRVEPLYRQVIESAQPIVNREARGRSPQPPHEERVWVSNYYPLIASGEVAGVNIVVQDLTDLHQARDQLQALVGELAHRSRNALFVIMSIVKQSAQSATSAADAERIINARLEAMLRAQDIVLNSKEGASLRDLLESCLAPFALDRFLIAASPEAFVESEIATGLGLLIHELATNATKHGALSAADGCVIVQWTLEDGDLVRLTWREQGGPVVNAAPTRRGFGTRLFEVALVPQGGGVERLFAPEGVVCNLRIPLVRASRPLGGINQGTALAERLSSEG